MAKLTPHQTFHVRRLVLFGVLGIALLIAYGSPHVRPLTSNRVAVLAYATNMNHTDLLAAANQSRTANGLAPLSLSPQLNSAAQAKAQHMIDHNYWAHVAPDGTEPWVFFQNAGYNYRGAGENLAYGFDNGYDVNNGWMNSAGHRANILGDYIDVGFGIASGASYQGNQNTVVVAHYGLPQSVSSPPAPSPEPITPTPAAPTPATAAPSSVSPTTPSAQTDSQAAEQTVEQPSNEATQNEAAETTDTNSSGNEQSTPVSNGDTLITKSVTAFEQIRAGKVPVAVAGSLSLVMVATGGFAMTHRQFMRHLIANGKQWFTHHPLVDIAALVVVIIAILLSTVGKLL